MRQQYTCVTQQEESGVPDLSGDPIRKFYGFTGMIDDSGATRLAAALNQAVNEGVEEVHLCISSLGGFVHSGVFRAQSHASAAAKGRCLQYGNSGLYRDRRLRRGH